MGAWDLSGQRAIVTGSTHGIGLAIAEELLMHGAAVFICARRAADVASVSSRLSAHGEVHGLAADLSMAEGRDGLLSAADAVWPGGLDILVNNVGTNIRKPSLSYTLSDLRALMAVNLESAWGLSQGCHPRLVARGGGRIINVSSVSSQVIVQTSTAAYAMTKGAMDQMTRFFAVEWAPDNIRVNSVHPWYIRTPLAEQVLQVPEKRARIVDATPAGRVGEPEEVARAVAFLAMEASSYVSGVHLTVDGAFSRLGVR